MSEPVGASRRTPRMRRPADGSGRGGSRNRRSPWMVGALGLLAIFAWCDMALAQGGRSASRIPADPWPREVTLADATLLIYQPQVNAWQGNTLEFRAAVAIKPKSGTQETFGVVWATARTQVDRVSRIVALEDFTVTRSNFPTLPDGGARYLSAL